VLDHFGDDLLWYLDDFILRKQPRINVWHCSIYSIRQMLPVQQLVRARAALLVPQTPSLISPDTARACLPATHVTRAAGRWHFFRDDLRRMRTFGQAPKVAPPAVTK
jgi:hypothetical protein